MKLELSSEQLKACWDAMKYYHRLTGYQDVGIGSLTTKLYGLWQHSIHLAKLGGDEIGTGGRYKEYKETGEPVEDGDATPGLAKEEPGLQQRVPSSLHEDPKGESPCGAGERRQGTGSRGGSGEVPGAQGKSSGEEHQEEAVRDDSGQELLNLQSEEVCQCKSCGENYGF